MSARFTMFCGLTGQLWHYAVAGLESEQYGLAATQPGLGQGILDFP